MPATLIDGTRARDGLIPEVLLIQVGDGAQAKFDPATMVAKTLNVQRHGGHGH